jgi:WD40 repeat protein
LAFCGNSWLAVGGSDNSIRLWDVENLTQPFELEGHTGTITRLVWDSGSSTLYSASYDTTIRVWSLQKAITSDAVISRRPDKTAVR